MFLFISFNIIPQNNIKTKFFFKILIRIKTKTCFQYILQVLYFEIELNLKGYKNLDFSKSDQAQFNKCVANCEQSSSVMKFTLFDKLNHILIRTLCVVIVHNALKHIL